MRALNIKLIRNLWKLRGQVLAIAVVIASGVAVLVMSLSALQALHDTAAAYYERQRFADVFTNVKRAPRRLVERISAIPGVRSVEVRIKQLATLSIEGFEEPVVGQLVSIPEQGEPRLNRLVLRSGRLVALGHPDEVVLSEPFAEAHGLQPGDQLKALMNGNQRTLTVVGIALSPEFIYAIGPGALIPDDLRYGVMWMGDEALAAAYDLDGAFNDLSLGLLHGTNPKLVIEHIDRLLERYGSSGAIARKDQISNWFLMNEIEQLKTMSTILPTIFLAVAAFLSNMVLSRLIATDRSEIGLMKAFGYSNWQVGWHYTKLVMAMTSVGILLGWLLGAWLGRVNTEIYADLFRFPLLIFRPDAGVFALGAIVSLIAALAGSLGSVRRAAALPPAEAMRPPAPPMFRKTGLSRSRVAHWLDQPTRIILRQIFRSPLRALLTSFGIALSVAVMVMALQWIDSIEKIVQVYFHDAQRQNMMVGLVETQSDTTLEEFRRMPGVLAVEPMRFVSANLSAGNRSHRGSIEGISSTPELQRVYDASGAVLEVPADGLILSTKLADKLGVGIGESVWIEVLEDQRPVHKLPVVALFETYMGMPAYMNIDAFNRMMGQRPSLEAVNLLVDKSQLSRLYQRLKSIPKVSSVVLKDAAVQEFNDTMGETLMIYISFFAAFAGALGFGVVYNSTRIALSERGRELATLRVLGFHRGEISYILLGEAALLILVGLPLGCFVGHGLGWLMTSAMDSELYRIPLVIKAATDATAVLVTLGATAFSAAVVRRRLDNLDLIAVLKTRE
ncbi:MAG: ABC transporter permease [Candidatus Thiodiazotropha sp. (ex Lucinoma borealis)]|nr:ABC transporter permease [Candidatus Thiodiazotropha sp. (ex Lucinoma borealis)]MCU7868829.1 ABC transporter permease [Candidatus Thiodiazotropha sp. (ex Lucinoma borealis)]